ncbi:MAG: glycosyltransferase [Bacteroidetes bacterium]|nr:glycosyltransferase [Bacteroidota bacterium]
MSAPRLCVIAPCFNEGEVAVRFVRELEQVLAPIPGGAVIVMVDDASTDDTLHRLETLRPTTSQVDLQVIALSYNMGHQEAIYQGLLHAATIGAERFVVMDSDGEDDPAAIVEMMTADAEGITLVARGKRRESWRFKLGYMLYRRMFRLVTKRSISFGNYSMIDRRVLGIAIDRGFIHYAAFLSRQRVPTRTITYDRRSRLDGRSKMSFKSLSIHAFRSLIEYSEDVLSLFLKGFFILAVAAFAAIIIILCVKLFTDEAIPGWASILTVSLLNSTLLCLGFFAIGLLLVNSIHRRDRAGKPHYRSISHGH